MASTFFSSLWTSWSKSSSKAKIDEVLDSFTVKMTQALVARSEDDNDDDGDGSTGNKISIGFIGGDIPIFPPYAVLFLTFFWGLTWVNSSMAGGTRLRFVPKILGGGGQSLWKRLTVAVVMIACGLNLIMATKAELQRVGTVPNFQEVVEVASQGPYAWTRNGMYVGVLIIQTAIAIACDSTYMLLSMVCMAIYLDQIVIPVEEDFLVQELKLPYIEYRLEVPRWIGF
mmetsp:Transcript_45157/g.109940  ORF Transcript_45157/g.109940 Transcript_45157/m.109940 type:complete len:228 (+) Transcript_45157:195-878(+)